VPVSRTLGNLDALSVLLHPPEPLSNRFPPAARRASDLLWDNTQRAGFLIQADDARSHSTNHVGLGNNNGSANWCLGEAAMATIITVHGTFASGPEEGEKWWQKGSEFERDVREFVEAENGNLDFRPHIWDGMNSETSRRAAGRDLLQEVKRLEARNEQILPVGPQSWRLSDQFHTFTCFDKEELFADHEPLDYNWYAVHSDKTKGAAIQ
jgi:hypothetical protein